MGIWFAAAASLVIGILIGFYSGYQASQGTAVSLFPGSAAAPQERQRSATTSASTTGFSESAVTDPPRIEPEPIVPAPATPPAPTPAAPQPGRAASTSAAAQRAPRTAPSPAAATREKAATPDTIAPDRAPVRRTPPVQAATATGPGTVRVLSRPAGAQVLLDGRVIGKTPLEIGALSPGEHSIRLELPGFKRWESTVDLKPGDELRVAGTLELE